MLYKRMPIEIESPESLGYNTIECNLAESSVRDVLFKDVQLNLNELVIAYGDHIGKPQLRSLIASFYPRISAEHILLTAGAAGALFIIHTSFLTSADHLVVIRPNYATNIETPKAIGCSISYIDVVFEENYLLDMGKLKAAIQPNTKIISITTPHNPTGTILPATQLYELIALVEERNICLLVDETYRDLSFIQTSPLAASLSKNVISVSSVSKAYGIPGIRIGWLITQNSAWQQLFLAAKEQIHICNSVVDEEICYQYLLKKELYFSSIQDIVHQCFTELNYWMNEHIYLEWVAPTGGVVCFPRFKKTVAIDTELFYQVLLNEYKTYVGPGHWFEQSKKHFRLGFGWETPQLFTKGLANIDKAIAKAVIH